MAIQVPINGYSCEKRKAFLSHLMSTNDFHVMTINFGNDIGVDLQSPVGATDIRQGVKRSGTPAQRVDVYRVP